MTEWIFHLCHAQEWATALAAGGYDGSSQDRADGFIHFSTAEQARRSAAKHRAGQTGLVILAVATAALDDGLRWEPSRGGALFPHYYGRLPLNAVRAVAPAPLGVDGAPVLPDLGAPERWA